MLGFELPAANTTIRVISDSRKNVWVGADAVFISEKPYLYFEADLKRRDEVNVVYKGGADSIWSGVAPVFTSGLDLPSWKPVDGSLKQLTLLS